MGLKYAQAILVTYAFKVITNWASGQNWFHMTLGSSLVGGTKLVCETPLVRFSHAFLYFCTQPLNSSLLYLLRML